MLYLAAPGVFAVFYLILTGVVRVWIQVTIAALGTNKQELSKIVILYTNTILHFLNDDAKLYMKHTLHCKSTIIYGMQLMPALVQIGGKKLPKLFWIYVKK